MPRKRELKTVDFTGAFPTRLRKIMGAQNKTQQDVATAVGKTRQAIGYYADGSSSPDWKTIVKIAQYFEVSTDWLLGISEFSSKDNETVAARDLGLSECAIAALKDLALEPSMRDIVVPVLNRLVYMEEFENLLVGLCGLKTATEHISSNPAPAIMTPKWKRAQKDMDDAI